MTHSQKLDAAGLAGRTSAATDANPYNLNREPAYHSAWEVHHRQAHSK